MADQPARAVIIYGDGLMRDVEPRHSHLHSLAAAGSCGFLALRSQQNQCGDVDSKRVVDELAQFLDIHDIYKKEAASDVAAGVPDATFTAGSQLPSISERFMGMKAGMFANSEPAAILGTSAGFSMLEMREMRENAEPCRRHGALSKPSVTALRLLNLLGLEDGEDAGVKTQQKQSDLELVVLHLSTAGGEQDGEKERGQLIDWVDELVGELRALAQPGTKANRHLYLVVVLGYGSPEVCNNEPLQSNGQLPFLTSNDEKLSSVLAQLIPQPTYKMKRGHVVENVREHHPLLVVYQLDAVTRRDEVKAFNHDEFLNRSGNLTILVDHLLHEVAFKLWKAPKYGA